MAEDPNVQKLFDLIKRLRRDDGSSGSPPSRDADEGDGGDESDGEDRKVGSKRGMLARAPRKVKEKHVEQAEVVTTKAKKQIKGVNPAPAIETRPRTSSSSGRSKDQVEYDLVMTEIKELEAELALLA